MIRQASKTLAALAAGAAIIVGAGMGIACSSDDDDGASPTAAATAAPTVDAAAKDVQGTLEGVADAWNAKDTDTFVAGWTEKGLIGSFGAPDASVDDVKAQLSEFIGSEEIGNFEFLETKVDGDSATIDTQYTFGITFSRSVFTFVKTGDDWLIDNEDQDIAIKVPEGATSIDVSLNEFAFAVNTDSLGEAEGAIALVAENVGEQDHEVGVIMIDEGVDLLAALQQADPQAGEDPEGVTFLGGNYVPVGVSATVAFREPFAPGRYAFVCFLPDTTEGEDGTPHALKGMITEFTIE